jgi:uncharacterized protein YjbI with pentapeptide repeats
MKYKHIDGTYVQELEGLKGLEEEELQSIPLQKVNFSKVSLRGSKFVDCKFDECDFSMANLCGAEFHHCEFLNSNLWAIDADQVRVVSSLINGCKFDDAELNHAFFGDCRIANTTFRWCNLTDAGFLRCEINETEFSSSTVRDTCYPQSNLDKVDFSYVADWNQIQLRHAVLNNVKFPEEWPLGSNEQKFWDKRRATGRG